MADTKLEIRREVPEDIAAVRRVNLEAFPSPYEANLVDRLRDDGAHVLSLVALKNDRVVGHILFSPVTIHGDASTFEIVGLAPMAVYSHLQRSGIGGSLIRKSLAILEDEGAFAIVLLGHPDYYPRFGFRPASEFGITYGYRVPDEAFMALELKAGALKENPGLAKYHPAFDESHIGPTSS